MRRYLVKSLKQETWGTWIPWTAWAWRNFNTGLQCWTWQELEGIQLPSFHLSWVQSFQYESAVQPKKANSAKVSIHFSEINYSFWLQPVSPSEWVASQNSWTLKFVKNGRLILKKITKSWFTRAIFSSPWGSALAHWKILRHLKWKFHWTKRELLTGVTLGHLYTHLCVCMYACVSSFKHSTASIVLMLLSGIYKSLLHL